MEKGLNDINAVLPTNAAVPEDLLDASAKIYDPSKVPAPYGIVFTHDEQVDSDALKESFETGAAQSFIVDVQAEETRRTQAVTSAAPADPTAIVTAQELADLKTQINDSFSEIAHLLLDLTNRMDLLDERIAKYNTRSGQKI